MITEAIRPIVHTDVKKITLRGAVDWYKAQLKNADLFATADDRYYSDTQWGAIVSKLAGEHMLPVGALSYMLAQMAQLELTLAQTVLTEAADAGLEVSEISESLL